MRRIVIAILVLTCASCMQKQKDGTYRMPVSTDTSKARENAARSGDQLRAKTEQLGRAAEKSLGKVAQEAGAKLQQAGQKAETNAAKKH